MKLVEGVELHLIKSEKFKMNHLTFRFSGDFSQKTVARRVLVAQILATANAEYPTAQLVFMVQRCQPKCQPRD